MTPADYLAQARQAALVASLIESDEDRRGMLDYARRLRARARTTAVGTNGSPQEPRSWR